MRFCRQAGPGLLLAGAIGVASVLLGNLDMFASRGLSALTLAIVLGMVAGNTVYPRVAAAATPGVGVAKQTLLRAGVVLYGLRLTWQDIGGVGAAGVAIDAIMLLSTFGLAWLLGTRVFRMDRSSAWLIGAGSAICGAAAVMATAPVVRAKADQVAVAVATVVVFGTLGMFLYPLMYELGGHLLPGGTHGFGVYIGSTVHEVAQVIAAARAVGTEAADTAVIAKMVRVMMLAPFLMALSAWLFWDGAKSRAGEQGGPRGLAALCIPWFAVGFIAMVAFNSLVQIPAPMKSALIDFDTLLLAIAMAALGLTTHVGAIRRAGLKPLVLAGALFVWLVGGGAAVNALLG